MKISEKRKAGAILDRGGIAERITLIAREIDRGDYKQAIELAGRIAELVDAASFDDYWKEKVDIGRSKEQRKFLNLINNPASKGCLFDEI